MSRELNKKEGGIMTDSGIISLFFERSDNAVAELSKKYETICMKTSYNIVNNKQDAEECVNDTYLCVWNSVPPEKPNPLLSYVLRIVRNISINKYKYNNRKKRCDNYALCIDELESVISSAETVETEYELRQLVIHINDFLAHTEKLNRMLFLRRYWFMDSYVDISKSFGMREGTVRTRISRIKKQLGEYLLEKGIHV